MNTQLGAGMAKGESSETTIPKLQRTSSRVEDGARGSIFTKDPDLEGSISSQRMVKENMMSC